jgi:hypothetical protein
MNQANQELRDKKFLPLDLHDFSKLSFLRTCPYIITIAGGRRILLGGLLNLFLACWASKNGMITVTVLWCEM